MYQKYACFTITELMRTGKTDIWNVCSNKIWRQTRPINLRVITSKWGLKQRMTISVHASLHAVFRVGKPQYDLLRFDFQVGFWRDRRLTDRRSRRRRLLLLSLLREPAPGEQPDGAERSAWDVQLSLRRCGRRQPELRQLLPLQHRSIRYLLHSGGLTSASSHDRGEVGGLSSWSITGAFLINLSHAANTSVSTSR